MQNCSHRLAAVLACIVGTGCLSAMPVTARAAATPEETFFESRIRPLLAENCFECHGSRKSENGLRLDGLESLLRGGDRGAAVVPGDVDASLLIKAVRRHDPDLEMPPDNPLKPGQIDELARWIADGAVWPGGGVPVDENKMAERARSHWAFQPVTHPPAPPRGDSGWGRTAIDRFIAEKLDREGLTANPPADKRALIRRATFDLTGLPPTPEETTAFLEDESPAPFARLVDRLLASPEYGRKWGRHWLDLARYADTAGDTSDYPIPQMYRYRDYVVDAFNEDKPYDQFIREQLAGDILASRQPDEPGFDEKIIATGFLALAPQFGPKLRQSKHLMIENTLITVGEGLMGLTVGCARCHDHKFEPISTRDYYGLYGYFQGTVYPHAGSEEAPQPGGLAPLSGDPELRGSYVEYSEKSAELGNKILLAKRGQTKEHSLAEWRRMFRELQSNRPTVEAVAFAVRDAPAPQDAAIQQRGDPARAGDTVPRGFVQVIAGDNRPAIEHGQSGRLQLADWIASPDHPLTARVMANRIWHHHFGRGLVSSLNNFGLMGSPPTHPNLLDHLASSFIEDGWSIKAMHRRIMNSAVYQLSSLPNETDHGLDADNRWYWRFDRRRLSGEEIRDAMLAIGARLDSSAGGPHPFPPVEKWGVKVHFTQHRPFHDVYPSKRRSIYLMTQRLEEHPVLGLFDPPDRGVITPARRASTVPLQSLFMMNSEFIANQGEAMARRLLDETAGNADPNPGPMIRRAHELAWGTPPDESLSQGAGEYLAHIRRHLERTSPGLDKETLRLRSWASYCRVLLTSNPFVYVD